MLRLPPSTERPSLFGHPLRRKSPQLQRLHRSSLAAWPLTAVLTLLVSLSLSPLLPAQNDLPDTTVEASLLGRRVAVGQSAIFRVHVANGQPEALPTEIPTPGLEVRYQGFESDGKRDSQGRQTVDYFYYYSVSGKQVGTFTIPGITVKVRGKDYQTKPVEFVVYEPSQDDLTLNASQPYFLRLNLLVKELYEHQMVPVDLTAYSRGRGSLKQMSSPQLGDSEFVVKPFSRPDKASSIDIDGYVYEAATITSAAFPIRAGELELGPIEMDCRIEKSESKSRPGFRSIFTHSESVAMTSNAVKLTVKPLPTEGRPADFADTVGRFELEVSASPTKLRVGDPISVDLVVKGIGNFDNVPAPAFQISDDRAWRTYEPRRTQDPTQTSDGVTPGRVTFTQIVIPQTTATELPAFTLSFFDPETAQYQTLKTDPVPLLVEADPGRPAASTVAVPGTSTQASLGRGPGTRSQPEATLTDILSIKTGATSWIGEPTELSQRWYFWLPQAIPATALLLLVGSVAGGFVRRRLANRNTADRRVSFEELRRDLGSASVTAGRESYYHHIQRCLDAWRRENPKADSALSAPTAARLSELEANIHTVLYSGSRTEAPGPPSVAETEQAGAVLESLASGLR